MTEKKRQIITLVVESDEGVEMGRPANCVTWGKWSCHAKLIGDNVKIISHNIQTQPDTDPSIAKETDADNLPYDLPDGLPGQLLGPDDEAGRLIQCSCGHKYKLGWSSCPMCEADKNDEPCDPPCGDPECACACPVPDPAWMEQQEYAKTAPVDPVTGLKKNKQGEVMFIKIAQTTV